MSPALPPRTPRTTAARTAALALALGLGLTACGSGLRAQTYQERATSDSTNEAVGALSVRHLRVLPPTGGAGTYPVGSTARVALVLVNDGSEDDRLVGVTTDAASSVAVVGPTKDLVVPAQGVTSSYGFDLRGLTRELRPGQYVEMELTFAENGSETLLVPIEVTGTPGPRRKGYHPAETDSNGDPVVEEEQSAEEGTDDRPELDNDGADAGSGDQVIDPASDPKGDGNGGESAAEPPPEG